MTWSRGTNLQIKNGIACFKVQNKGRFTATETIQVYVGKQNSAIIRPKKELKFFEKVTLAPGSSVQITFDIGKFKFLVYRLL